MIPDWELISFADKVTYLGVVIGPGAGVASWTGPTVKWRERGRKISSIGGSVFRRFALYSRRAETTLQYPSHFSLLPRSIRREEHGMVARL